MTTSTGSSLQNRSSRPIEAWAASFPSGLGICFFAGAAAALVDLYLRAPLHMPGWRGLITMGLLIAARQLSARAWAASAAAFATALTSVALAGPPRFTTLAFLVPGLVIDSFYFLAPRWQTSTIIAGFAAGLGNIAKFAVTLFGITAFARRDGDLAGMLMPWLSHFFFGFCGGLIAVLLAKPWSKRSL